MKVLSRPKVQFLPFKDSASARGPGKKGGPRRPSPRWDQAHYGSVQAHAPARPIVRNRGGKGKAGEDYHDTIGEDYHDVLGEDYHDIIGAAAPGYASVGLGYHPDLADMRDRYALDRKSREKTLMTWLEESKEEPGEELEGRYSIADQGPCPLPAIEDQGSLQSCTANAVISMVEYLMRRYTEESEDFSRMFLYRASRRLLGLSGDSGAYIRTTIKALRLFGVPPEQSWPYDPALLDQEPGAYEYSYAQNYKTLHYARLDKYGADAKALIEDLKLVLRYNFPVAFGFPVYDNINNMKDWVIPIPTKNEKLIGGHAVAAVGYDRKVGENGCLIIRNSWGLGWGDLGYAYLPFEYVEKGWAMDFWTVYDDQWLKSKPFEDSQT